jgi:aquaporin NIP
MVNFKKFLAEAVGTFILVFCGTGAIIINQESGGMVTYPGIAITFGLVVLAMIHTIGDISGAHMNPAVTIAFAVAKRFKGSMVLPYVISQLVGALLASFVLGVLFPQNEMLGATQPAGSQMQSFILELILTFILMFVILNVSTGAKEKGITAGISIASVVGLEAMFAGPVCGASMNPARSVGPAVVSGHLDFLWLYILAPVSGALLAILVYKFTRTENEGQQDAL